MDTKTEFKPPSLCCILHILQTCHLQYKAHRATVSKVEARSVFPTPASDFYLDCFVLGSLITKHSFRSPNLLKYSCRPSETDDKNGPLRNRELNHNRLFQTWLISAHFVGVGKPTPRPFYCGRKRFTTATISKLIQGSTKFPTCRCFPTQASDEHLPVGEEKNGRHKKFMLTTKFATS